MAKHYRLTSFVLPTLRRTLHPAHLYRALRKSRRSDEGIQSGDERLRLFSRILPGGYLNYGFHEDVHAQPDELSLADIARSQRRYGALIIDRLDGIDGPVLDVGCGMGGLLGDLRARGFDALGVTPDRHQVEFLRREHPDLVVVQSKLERLDPEEYRGRFAAVVNAESIQYVRLRRALPVLDAILAPGGRWVVCDYFRHEHGEHGGGKVYGEFLEHVDGRFRVVYERDITDHVLPTLAFAHMCGRRFGLPLLDLVIGNLERRRPGTHHLLEETLDVLRGTAEEVVDIVDPEAFAAGGRYRLLVLRRV